MCGCVCVCVFEKGKEREAGKGEIFFLDFLVGKGKKINVFIPIFLFTKRVSVLNCSWSMYKGPMDKAKEG